MPATERASAFLDRLGPYGEFLTTKKAVNACKETTTYFKILNNLYIKSKNGSTEMEIPSNETNMIILQRNHLKHKLIHEFSSDFPAFPTIFSAFLPAFPTFLAHFTRFFCQNLGWKFAKVLIENLPKSWFWIILKLWNTENA